jgi:hypothetical protein
MKGPITVVLATFLAVAAFAQSTAPTGSSADRSSPILIALDPAPTSASVRIRTPVADEKFIHTTSVKVRFDVIGPVPSAGTPNFLVQLDGDEPVRTSNMEQTFSDLAPGTHSVSVQLVGDNNTPNTDSRADVQFEIAPHAATPSHRAATPVSADTVAEALNVAPEQNAPQPPPQLSQVAVQQAPPAEIMSISSPLPSAGSALPLISVIGFGVLVGGIASAMKTR